MKCICGRHFPSVEGAKKCDVCTANFQRVREEIEESQRRAEAGTAEKPTRRLRSVPNKEQSE